MTNGDKSEGAAKRPHPVPREERLAAALRENLRRRKVAKKRVSAEDVEDEEGPVDDRD